MKGHVSFSHISLFMCSMSCHMPKAVGSEIPLESYCADTEMQESSATHLSNLVFVWKRAQLHHKCRGWWTQLFIKISLLTLQMRSQECCGVGTLTLYYAFLFMLSSGCHMPVSVTLKQLRESPLTTMHSNLPFLICISWCVVVLVLMLVCAFSVFNPRGRQGSERFYQGLLSSVVDGRYYPQGRSSSCLKRSLWYGKYSNAMVLSIL